MGLVKGSEIKVERIAPLGDPIEIKVKGYCLSLRKDDAKKIEIKIA
ncbi:MAG: FeoA domain-containing protein [Methanobacteriaceae archaeon]|nr:FeoA domain-containing protein [Methanobacteriaceae archaeon]